MRYVIKFTIASPSNGCKCCYIGCCLMVFNFRHACSNNGSHFSNPIINRHGRCYIFICLQFSLLSIESFAKAQLRPCKFNLTFNDKNVTLSIQFRLHSRFQLFNQHYLFSHIIKLKFFI